MFSCFKLLILVFAGGMFVASVDARNVSRADFSQRERHLSERRFPMAEKNFSVNEQIGSKRFGVEEWHAKFTPLGQKRARANDADVRQVEVIDHRTLDFDRNEYSMARHDGHRAYHRNLNSVQQPERADGYKDPRIIDVPLQTKAMTGGEKELSMRDINRIVYGRNHSDEEGLNVQPAGSGE